MNKLRLPFFCSLLILALNSANFTTIAQEEEDTKMKSVFLEAESYFLFEEYKDALPLYQRILKADPDNFNINYKIGICYINDVYQKHKAVSYLEKAVQGTSPAYKQNNYKERMAPLEAYYYLGNAYRINNRLNDAIEAYYQFKKILDPVVYDEELVDQQIKACKVAADLQSRPNYYISVNLGEIINDRFEEINPVISGDESVLVFTRKLQFYDAVFYSEKVNGKWSEPINLTPSFGVDGNSYSTGLSYDGKELFVYRLDDFDGNIYVSKREGNKWSKLVKLNENINTKYWESHASVSRDGKTLYFTSNRKDGYGGLDIYKSERTKGGDWGPAINLGPVINSKYNEESPFISEDGKILFFSSMGHYNMGGYDIFYSIRLDNGQWTKPVNLGYPVNTTGDDLFLTPVKNGEYAYYSTYDPADSYGLADIYKLEIFSDRHPRKFILNGITRVESELKIDFSKITVSLIDKKTKNVIDKTQVNPDGSFTLNALSGNFEMVFEGDGIQKTTEDISIPINNPSNIITYTSPLIAPGLAKEDKGARGKHEELKNVPTLICSIDRLDVTSGDPIPIKLELERNTRLTIETYLNESLQKTEEFDISRKKFVYMFKPQPGINLLKLTLADQEGNINSHEIIINYTPSAEELAKLKKESSQASSLRDLYKALISLSEGNIKSFLENTNFDSLHFSSLYSLYKYLINNATANGYSIDEVDRLFIQLLASKDINIFHNDMLYLSSGNLKLTLDTIDIHKLNLFYPLEYLNLLYDNASINKYSKTDLQRILLLSVTAGNEDLIRFISLLKEYANDSLKNALLQVDLIKQGINQPSALINYLIQNHPALESALDDALNNAAINLDMMFLYQSLLFVSGDSLRNTLVKLNPEKENIITSGQLIEYLWKKSATNGYTLEELINLIDNIRKDPYYYVDMFRKLLASKAKGSLKTFLDEMDVRALHLDTYEKLLDYLLRESAYHEYNRETIYSLLLDLINPHDVEDFISMLKRYAGKNILDAVNSIDLQLYSTPLEVIKYLLSVSDQYHYTERDILNLLLKLIFEKRQWTEESAGFGKTLLDYLRRPGVARTLIIINGIILILIILYVFRRKSKKK
jgi:hypothetical protein